MTNEYVITTDSITTTIAADDANDAAKKFAKSERITDIGNAADLVAHFEAREGWCRINPA